MSGIKLKSNSLPPLKVERIKWIIILVLSHVISILLSNTPELKVKNEFVSVPPGYIRLQLQLQSNVPDNNKTNEVIIVTSDRKLITRNGRLLSKVKSSNSLGTIENEYLVELPEEDLTKLIEAKGKGLKVYPASQKISIYKNQKRGPRYEIIF